MSKEKKEEKDNFIIKDRKTGKEIVAITIKADYTPEALAVHNAFREFCQAETQDNYTQGLRRLLENTEKQFMIELLSQKVLELESKLNTENKESKKDKKDLGGTF